MADQDAVFKALADTTRRSLLDELRDRHQGDEPKDLGVVEMELVADVREQDAEGCAVELVDGVQPEEHDEREGGLTSADIA